MPLAAKAILGVVLAVASASGDQLDPGHKLIATFSTTPNESDLLMLFSKDMHTVTGKPVFTATLFDGNQVLGSYRAAPRCSERGCYLTLTFKDRASSASSTAASADFTAIRKGTSTARIEVTVSGGSISGFNSSDLILYDAVSVDRGYRPLQHVIRRRVGVDIPLNPATLTAPPAAVVDRTVTIPVQFQMGLSRDHWDRGYWIQYSRADNLVWAYDRNGANTIQKTKVEFPQASRTALRSVAAAGDGTLVGSAQAWGSAGAVTTFLFRIRPPGQLTDIVRTDSFVGQALGVSGTGEIWSFGANPNGTWSDNLERYSSEGRRIATYLPRASFVGGGNNPALGVNGSAYMATSSSRVGILTPIPAAKWTEFDSTGKQVANFPISFPAVEGVPPYDPRSSSVAGLWMVAELVMTEDNRVYAALFVQNTSNKQHSGVFQLDRDGREWLRVPTSSFPPNFGGLFGADGNSLILRSGCCTYGWVKAPDMLSN